MDAFSVDDKPEREVGVFSGDAWMNQLATGRVDQHRQTMAAHAEVIPRGWEPSLDSWFRRMIHSRQLPRTGRNPQWCNKGDR